MGRPSRHQGPPGHKSSLERSLLQVAANGDPMPHCKHPFAVIASAALAMARIRWHNHIFKLELNHNKTIAKHTHTHHPTHTTQNMNLKKTKTLNNIKSA